MAFAVLYSIEDAKGQVSTMTVNVPATTDFADVGAFAAGMAGLINALITGVITRIGVAFTVALPGGLRTVPVAGSDTEEGALFQFRTELGNYTSTRLPTFDETLIQSNSRAVDTEDADVTAFITAMVTGIDVTPVVAPSDKREEDIIGLASALEDFQSSRAG